MPKSWRKKALAAASDTLNTSPARTLGASDGHTAPVSVNSCAPVLSAVSISSSAALLIASCSGISVFSSLSPQLPPLSFQRK